MSADSGGVVRTPLASTKFVVPPVPDCYVARPRLHEALNRGAGVPVTTVIGPPGSGKTVAVSSWLATQSSTRAMWMSCDGRDADPATFWRGMTEGLTRLWPDHWLEVRDLLDEDRPSLQDVAIVSANALHTVGEPVTIVIDDYHIAKQADPTVADLIGAIPAANRVLFVSRADPALPLHRMRVQHELLELRDDELRLSATETAALARALGLALDPESADLLYHRTNGWLAAVHLAALSLRDRPDALGFLREFSGENRLVAEFLVGEVLSRQPEPVQRFLEDSSVLEELDLEACRAVTGVADSARLLRELSAQNALIMPSGDGHTYRYHRLFRDLLQFRLRAESPERYAALHEAAAAWYSKQGEYDRAAGHLTSAGDDDGAYAVLRDHAYDMLLNGGPSALNQVVTELDLRRADEPSRAVDIGVALAIVGATDEAERWIVRVDPTDTTLSDIDAARFASGRAMFGLMRGDLSACEAALADLARLDVRDSVAGGTPMLGAAARLWLDDTSGARAAYAAAFDRRDVTVVTHDVMLPALLVTVAAAEGELREAERLAKQVLDRAETYDLLEHPMTANTLIGRGLVRHERGEFEAAELDLERAARLAEPSRPPVALMARVVLARLCITEGRFLEAQAMLTTARTLLPRRSTSPLLDFVSASETRLALARGDLDGAERLIRAVRPSERRIRLNAALLLARGHAADALTALDRGAPITKRQRFDTALLRARALHALRDPGADDALVATIALALEEGFVVSLVDDLPELVRRISYHLRTVTIGPFEQAALDRIDRPRVSAAAPDDVDLVEKLTPREQTILRYLSSRLTIKEIATECYVSPNTVKSQAQAVYRKLGVSSRREATAEGQRLRLI